MYKYTEKFVADLLFNKNSIRIGTLEGFRDMESKQGISDPLEGSYVDHLTLDYFNEKDFYTNPKLRENLNGAFNIGFGCSNIKVIDFKVKAKRKSPNYLIFCFAHTKSQEVMNQFDGADTCYQIHKPIQFLQLITWTLAQEFQRSVNFHGIHKVDYDEYERQRSGINSTPIHPAIAKTGEFRPQCELRAIWEVPEQYITKPYYDLTVVGLRKYCKIIDL